MTCNTSAVGLLLQGLARFIDQPSILHRNDRLRSEILQQRDLLVRERAHLLPIDDEVTEKRIFFAQRHREQGAAAAQLDEIAADRVARPVGLVLCDICDMDDRLAAQQTAMRVVRTDRMRSSSQELRKRRRCAADRGRMDLLAIIDPKSPESGAAQLQRFVQHRVENGSEVARGAVDDLQYLGGRGLLLQGFVTLGGAFS
jgi:hypothetical protein